MNISCTRCSPDLLGASLSDCQSVCLDISRNICLSVTRRQDCKCVRLPEWIVTGSFWEFLQAAGGGGTALVVTLVAGRLPLWTWTGWSGLCAGTLAEQLITTSPSPALRPPLEPPHPEWLHTTGDTSFNAGTNAAPFPLNPRFCNNVFKVGAKSGTRHCKTPL